MVTIEESLAKLVNSGVITNDEAYGRANNQAYFLSISKKK
jgi:Tfp pilus assembly pilus retraction ATPase PilT